MEESQRYDTILVGLLFCCDCNGFLDLIFS